MRIESQSKFFALLIIALPIAMTACDGSEPVVVQEPATRVNEAASPQGRVAVSEGYTLRANAIQTDLLPPEMLVEHGIEIDADRGLLSVVVLKQGPDGQDVTVAADVTAQQSNLIGQSREIDMRAITANDGRSYHGLFEFSPQDFFRFTITAQPVGTDKVLTVEFEERSGALR